MKKSAPKLKNVKTDWNFSLFYKSGKDPQIEKDIATIEAKYEAFVKKYAGREDYLKDEKKLAEALTDYEALSEGVTPSKPILYFIFRRDINSKDNEADARLTQISQWGTKLENTVVFFSVALSRIPVDDQKKFLASAVLVKFRYYLECTFAQAKHVLSEKEEKILNVKRLPSHELWVNGNDKLLGNQTVVWKKKTLALSEAGLIMTSLPTKERRALGSLVYNHLKNISTFAESEVNAIVINKKINDELRGYAKPYSATVLDYENKEETVQNLIDTVTKHFHIAHRFYKVKAKMLGLKTLEYADRGARVGTTKKKISFEQAVELVQKSFRNIDPVYEQTFNEYLKNGQVDVFPKIGKQSGAYCWSSRSTPTFVLLNHVENFNSIKTLAHEMGHAFHSKFSKEHQSPLYSGYSTATAEVASTFFENFVFEEAFKLLSPEEQIVALHDRINDSVSTIFRQIACFNFELELHTQIREKGSLPKEEIAKLMNKHMAAYLGPTFKLQEVDGYYFVNWGHIRRFFYVYSYAFGELVSSALFAKYKKDPSFETQIRQFLSAGGSASPEDIFKAIGVDVTKPEFFKEGLKKIEEDIDMLEKLVSKK